MPPALPSASSAIAVVGLAGRFPGARNVGEYWRNLCAGVESVVRYSNQELLDAGEDPELLRDPDYVRVGAPLADMEQFDAAFFGFSARDAAILDPQHRHFLEVCWEALEDAGHVPESFPGAIGVFAGSGMQAYFTYHLAPNRALMRDVGAFLVRHTGNDKDFLTTRVSYCLNLRGPSVAVQTACSTSLVAIHTAAQSLLNGECDLALAGGVTIELPHRLGYVFHENEILSPDGHCRAFDREARGTIFGSGAGVVVLRRADDAVADGDTIYALLRGSAVNNDGRGKVSYLAPSLDGQAQCVAEALAMAGVSARSIGYVEAHGTGTPVGDPIEVAALTRAFGAEPGGQPWCRLGSVKTNIGHLDTAAGVASFIKAALALRHRQIPPSLHFESPNPACGFAQSPFEVNTALTAWPAGDTPRRAGVNSLGVGGTNAHVILEEAPAPEPRLELDRPRLLCLSARSPAALDATAARLAQHLRNTPGLSLADVEHTLQVGRRHFRHRRAIACVDRDDALALLESPAHDRVHTQEAPAAAPPIVFMFPGGGAQYANMGRQLYETEPVFSAEVDRIVALVESVHGVALVRYLFPSPGEEVTAAAALEQASASLFSTFAVEYALATMWRARGVEPAALVGHSLGEVVAACVAGVMSLPDALAMVAARGRLLDRLPDGATMAVAMSEEALLPHLCAELSIAAVNGPALCVVSGSRAAVEALEATLTAAGIDCRRLRLAFAAHSSLLEGALAGFARDIAAIRLLPPQLPVMSNETGRWATADEITHAHYWVRHLRHTVRFADGLAGVLDDYPDAVLLEVGPGTTLTSLALRQRGRVTSRSVVASMRHRQDPTPDGLFLLGALGRLWLAGHDVDWARHRAAGQPRRVPLPTYPFEMERYWIDRPTSTASATTVAPVSHAAGGRPPAIDSWFEVPSWVAAQPPASTASAIRWLLFEAGDPLHDAVRQGLSSRGDAIVRVRRGAGYEARADGSFVVRPGDRSDCDRLLAALVLRGVRPARVAHLWGLGDRGADGAAAAADLSFHSLLVLAQAWDERHPGEALHVAVVSSGMQSVSSEPLTDPLRALALGPRLVIPAEYPSISCSSIDYQAFDRAGIDQLLGELRAETPDAIVACRRATRWIATTEPCPLLGHASSHVAWLKPGGVYLITGGFGGLGFAVAEHLARTVSARLVILGRGGVPDRAQWRRLTLEDSAESRRIAQILELEGLGAEVLAMTADVADSAQLEGAVAAAITRFGRIDGIFHTAGVLDDGPVATKTRESAGRVLRPKVLGTLALDSIIDRHRPDFLILFSSISSLVAVPGQVDYAAANAFLDAYAGSRRGRGGTRVVAIDWAAWRETGLAAKSLAAVEGVLTAHPLLGRRRELGAGRTEYAARVGPDTTWILDEHRIDGPTSVLPGTAYLEIARAAVGFAAPGQSLAIDELLLLVPLTVEAGAECDLRITLDAVVPGEAWSASIASWSGADAGWVEHARARARRLDDGVPRPLDLGGLSAACDVREVIAGPWWRSPQERRLALGLRWRCLRRIRLGRDQAMVELALPPELAGDTMTLAVHPALLDQAVGGALALIGGDDDGEAFYVPMAFEGVRIWQPLPPSLRVRARRRDADEGTATFELTVADETGVVVLEIERLTVRRIDAGTELIRRPHPGSSSSEPPRPPTVLQTLLADGIDTASGLAALDRILMHGALSHVVVSPLPLAQVHSNLANVAKAGHAGRDGQGSRRLVAPRTDAERLVTALWSKALGVEAVSVEDNWFELGGHSLLGIRVLSQLRRVCNVDLPPQFFFESPTVAEQARSIERAHSTQQAPDADRLVPAGREQFRRARQGRRA